MYYYNARWYDPALGRFAQADTIVPEASQGVQAWDRYAYVNNNPLKYTDPSGHCLVLCTAIIGGAIGAIAGAVGYTVYAGVTGTEFNTSHMLMAAGGGAAAGALIGTGVGIAAGMSTAATTSAAVVNNACGGDLCASEVQDITSNATTAVSSNSTTAMQPYYPPNLGFSGSPQLTTISPGELVTRFGGTSGSFLSPANTPSWARSLPPGVQNLPYNTYQVVKPIGNALSGKISPWWGQIGGGTQYYIGSQHGQNIQTLLDSGYLIAK